MIEKELKKMRKNILVQFADAIVKQNSVLMKIFSVVLFLLYSLNIAAQTAGDSDYKFIENILYRSAEDAENDEYINERCRLDLCYPVDKDSFAVVVWFHGGGITGGSKFFPEKLKEQGFAVVAANYRLSPKVKNPAYIEDAAAVVAWVFKNIGKYGGDVSKIVVSGHSAGGYLAAIIGLDKKWLSDFGVDADRIAMLVPFSGHAITHFTIRNENNIKETQPVVDSYAPLYHVRNDAPPLILITGDRNLELLGRYEENAYLWRMMQVAGHKHTELYELDGFNHGGMASPAFEILLNEIKLLSK